MRDLVGPTPFDLHFGLFGIPVRVHPGFWIVSVLMGRGLLEQPELLLVWIVVLFVSILVHELGHALAAHASGYPVHVVLYHFGGYASYAPTHGTAFGKRYTHARSIWISFAGPLAGFLLYGIVVAVKYGLEANRVAYPYEVWFAFLQLEWVNLWWGIVNLAPVLPLDGGRICEELLVWRMGRRGLGYALQTGIVVGGLIALGFAYLEQSLSYPVVLFGVLSYMNFQRYQQFQSGAW